VDHAIAAFRKRGDHLRDVLQKGIPIARCKRSGGVHDGVEFGVGEGDRLRHGEIPREWCRMVSSDMFVPRPPTLATGAFFLHAIIARISGRRSNHWQHARGSVLPV